MGRFTSMRFFGTAGKICCSSSQAYERVQGDRSVHRQNLTVHTFLHDVVHLIYLEMGRAE